MSLEEQEKIYSETVKNYVLELESNINFHRFEYNNLLDKIELLKKHSEIMFKNLESEIAFYEDYKEAQKKYLI